MADNRNVIGGGGASLFTDYARPPPRASTALGLMSIHSPKPANSNVVGAAASSPTDFSKVIGGTVAVSDEVRSSPQYADWYYAQNPRDPRTPPPLIKGGKYGAPVRSNIHGPIGSPVPPSNSTSDAGVIGGGIPTSQPPTIALSAAPKAGNRYQPPSQRAPGAPAATIPLAKAPMPVPIGKQPTANAAPATGAGPSAGSNASPVDSSKVVGGPSKPSSAAHIANNAVTGVNPLLAGLSKASKASSIPDGEERWTDDLVEETIAPAPKPHYGASKTFIPPNVPAPPSEALLPKGSSGAPMAPVQQSAAAASSSPGNEATVIAGGQQFSLYARPFQPNPAMNTIGDQQYGGVADDSEESQYYAAMRSINANFNANEAASANTAGIRGAPSSFGVTNTGGSITVGGGFGGPTASGFTPYPQPQYSNTAAFGRGGAGNSPSHDAPYGGQRGGGDLMGGNDGFDDGWYGGNGGDAAYAGNEMGAGDFTLYGGRGGRGGRGNGRGVGGRGGGMGGGAPSMNNNASAMGGMSPGMRGPRGGGGHLGGQGLNNNNGGGAGGSTRSPFVEKFHVEHAAGGWRLTDVEGHVAEIAKDQEGSRFVQVQLDAAAQNGTLVKQLDDVLVELFIDQNTATDVICDVFGNYVVQKILEVATEAQLARIFNHLRGIIVNLTLQTYGCRVIQKAVEALRKYPALLEGLVAELEPNVPRCVQDQNGNHVIQKLVEINPDGAGFIIDAFRGKVRELATHAYGCRVIQCILSQCPRYEPDIMRELFVCLPDLTMDQYGNYVVQHVLQHGPANYIDICFEALKHRIYYCSRQKFASNVIEKLFHRCTRAQRQEFFDILCYCDPDVGATEQTTQQIQGKPLLSYFVLMMMDPFANYVVQKFVDEADEALRRQMMAHTMQYIEVLKAHHYGMHIINRFERSRYLPQGTSGMATTGPVPNAGGMHGGGNNYGNDRNDRNFGGDRNERGMGGRGGRGGGGNHGNNNNNNGPMGGNNNNGGSRGGRGRGGRGNAPRGL